MLEVDTVGEPEVVIFCWWWCWWCSRVRMAALQSEAGRALLLRAGRSSDDLSSLVLVEKDRYAKLLSLCEVPLLLFKIKSGTHYDMKSVPNLCPPMKFSGFSTFKLPW